MSMEVLDKSHLTISLGEKEMPCVCVFLIY